MATAGAVAMLSITGASVASGDGLSAVTEAGASETTPRAGVLAERDWIHVHVHWRSVGGHRVLVPRIGSQEQWL